MDALTGFNLLNTINSLNTLNADQKEMFDTLFNNSNKNEIKIIKPSDDGLLVISERRKKIDKRKFKITTINIIERERRKRRRLNKSSIGKDTKGSNTNTNNKLHVNKCVTVQAKKGTVNVTKFKDPNIKVKTGTPGKKPGPHKKIMTDKDTSKRIIEISKKHIKNSVIKAKKINGDNYCNSNSVEVTEVIPKVFTSEDEQSQSIVKKQFLDYKINSVKVLERDTPYNIYDEISDVSNENKVIDKEISIHTNMKNHRVSRSNVEHNIDYLMSHFSEVKDISNCKPRIYRKKSRLLENTID